MFTTSLNFNFAARATNERFICSKFLFQHVKSNKTLKCKLGLEKVFENRNSEGEGGGRGKLLPNHM